MHRLRMTLFLMGIIGLTIFCFIKIDTVASDWLPDSHEINVNRRLASTEFDSKDNFIVTIDLDNQEPFYNFEFLSSLNQIIDEIEEHPLVLEVNSFHTQQVISSQGEDGLMVSSARDMIEEGYLANEKEYRDFILSQENIASRLLTDSYRYMILIVRLDIAREEIISLVRKKDAVDCIQGVLNRSRWCQNYFCTGSFWSSYHLEDLVYRKSRSFLPLCILMMFLLLLFLLRSYRRTLLIFIIVMLSICTLCVLQLFFDVAFTNFSFVGICIILTLNISDAIHVLNHFDETYSQTKDWDFSRKKAIQSVFRPCFLTSLTTALAALSGLFTDILPLKEFSALSSIAILCSFFYMIGLCYIALKERWISAENLQNSLNSFNWCESFYKNLTCFVTKYCRLIVITLTSLIVVSAVVFYLYSTFESRLLESFFFRSSPIYQEMKFMNKHFGGTDILSVMLQKKEESQQADTFRRMEAFQKIDQVSQELNSLPEVNFVDSYHKLVRQVHRHLGRNSELLPTTNEALSQEISFLEFSKSDQRQDVLSPYFNFDGSLALLRLQCSFHPIGHMVQLIQEIDKKIKSHFSSYKVFYEGFVFADYFLNEALKKTFILGPLFSFFTIGIIFIYCFGLFWGIVGLIPNVLPIVLIYFLLPLTNQPADFALFLVTTISFGFCVDHTIHLLYFFRKHQKSESFELTFRHALQFLWKPIAYTTLVFVGGFLFFAFSCMFFLVKFSLLFSAVLLFGFMSDIFYLPALICWLGRLFGCSVSPSREFKK